MREANGKNVQRSFQLTSKRVEDLTPEFMNTKGTVRFLTCTVPESKKAMDILKNEMQKFGPQSWYSDFTPKYTQNSTYELVWRCRYKLGWTYTINVGTEDETIIYSYYEECGYEVVEKTPETEGEFGGGGGDIGEDEQVDPCNTPLGCDSGGGGIGGGFLPPESPSEDYVANADTTDIDCNSSNLLAYEKAWCASSIPKGENLANINNALDKISKRGDDCAEIAQKGKQLLDQYGIRYYPSGTIDDGGRGGPSYGVLLSDTWLTDYYVNNAAEVEDTDGTKVKINLEFMLVHEIEHTLYRYHTSANGEDNEWQTPNAVKCSGF